MGSYSYRVPSGSAFFGSSCKPVRASRPFISLLPDGPSAAFKVRGATRGQGRTNGDQRTWWRGLRIADRRKSSTFRVLVQVTGFLVFQDSTKLSIFWRESASPGVPP